MATGDRVPCVWVENDHVVNFDPKDPIKLDYTVKRGDTAAARIALAIRTFR